MSTVPLLTRLICQQSQRQHILPDRPNLMDSKFKEANISETRSNKRGFIHRKSTVGSHPVCGRRMQAFSQANWITMFDLDLDAYCIVDISSKTSDSMHRVKSICHFTKAEITAASLNAAIKTLQSRKAPNREDKDEGKQINAGQKTLTVNTTRMRSSCMIGTRCVTFMHEYLMQVNTRYFCTSLGHNCHFKFRSLGGLPLIIVLF